MGIPGLWDVIGNGQLTSLAKLATDHYTTYNKPFRIAIDEAGWRFSNLTPYQVQMIREKEPRANPIEKLILYRLLKILNLNIQLLFIFDGPRRPHKRGRVAGRIDYKQVELLQKTLKLLGIPYHRAPAEAEAECAALQQAGVVDAVWSEDGDSLMFGCDFLLRNYRDGDDKVSSKKSETHVRAYRMSHLKEEHGIDRHGLVLFAMINGCDYTKGIHGCGQAFAHEAARWHEGVLGRTLCATNERDLESWRESTRPFFEEKRRQVPADFPHKLALKHSRTPVISTLDQLNNLRGLKKGWHMKIDQLDIRDCLRAKYNFTTREYLKYIVPMLLLRELVHCQGKSKMASTFNLQIVHPRIRKDTAEETFEKMVQFDPVGLVPFDLTEQPPEEDWSTLVTKAVPVFNPIAMLKTEVPENVLRRVLPAETFEPPPAKTTNPRQAKRKSAEPLGDTDGAAPTTAPKKRSRSKKSTSAAQSTVEASPSPLALRPSPKKPQEPIRPALANRAGPINIDLSDHEDSLDDDFDDDLPDMAALLRPPGTRPPLQPSAAAKDEVRSAQVAPAQTTGTAQSSSKTAASTIHFAKPWSDRVPNIKSTTPPSIPAPANSAQTPETPPSPPKTKAANIDTAKSRSDRAPKMKSTTPPSIPADADFIDLT